MSDETAQKLAEAKAIEIARQAEMDDQKRECLAVIARGIPARVDEVAKREARDQPDVARQLGSDGIRALRKKLAEAAAALASEVEEASEQIHGQAPPTSLPMKFTRQFSLSCMVPEPIASPQF
jgi:hypothetical protein